MEVAPTSDNDPYGENDLGIVEINGDRYMWKIDYYDINFKYHSLDPADPRLTKRVVLKRKGFIW